MDEAQFAAALLKILNTTQTEFEETSGVSSASIKRYDELSDKVGGMPLAIREIYYYFWDFIVDDQPFELIGELGEDFVEASDILEGFVDQ